MLVVRAAKREGCVDAETVPARAAVGGGFAGFGGRGLRVGVVGRGWVALWRVEQAIEQLQWISFGAKRGERRLTRGVRSGYICICIPFPCKRRRASCLECCL